ncbi:hypothetical protein ITJ57_08325 [Plantibacter sp. VKM Ac-2880]|uniref:hypothetical protein n=1 Tax=Plantibacter sp. VKM Ac-2880 TaxID=2783827 RepID=UPI00188F3898|nr:hypothetical protein [Plantibacter sp. VKM Ac-2880]MBF4568776.1 hypothetical protein [Plantibacter sp. VKM Ac-2880]
MTWDIERRRAEAYVAAHRLIRAALNVSGSFNAGEVADALYQGMDVDIEHARIDVLHLLTLAAGDMLISLHGGSLAGALDRLDQLDAIVANHIQDLRFQEIVGFVGMQGVDNDEVS